MGINWNNVEILERIETEKRLSYEEGWKDGYNSGLIDGLEK